MRGKQLIFVIALVFASSLSSCLAQTELNKQIGFGVGFSIDALKSELLSSYTHSGSSSPIQLFFRSGGSKSKHHVQMQYSSATLRSSSQGLSTTDKKGYVQYAYHRRLQFIKSTIQFYGGILTEVKASLRDNNSPTGSVGNNDTGELIGSAGPSVLAEWPVRNSLISFQCWTSLLGYSYKQGYALSFPNESSWLSPNQFHELGSRLSLNKGLSTRMRARFDYQFQLYKLSQYENLGALNHQLLVSLVYTFR